MRILAILVSVAATLTGVAEAAPAADLVVVWAPNQDVQPVAAAARDAGVALVDKSPPAPVPTAIPAMVARGVEGYDKTRYDDAWKALEEAAAAVDKTGAEGMTAAQLSDLFLYRGLLRTQRGDPTAFDELAMALVVVPGRTFDPARFSPDVIENLERARTAISGRPKATLSVDAPPGCAIAVDGTTAEPGAPRVTGTHWVRVTCADTLPWGTRVDVSAPTTQVIARPVRYAPPSDADLLIQARTAGATALVFAEVRGDVATARLIGLDGKERNRRTVVIHGSLQPLAEAVRALLRPPERRKWYQSKWAWAGGAGLLAAAIAIPLTVIITRDPAPTTAILKIPGDKW